MESNGKKKISCDRTMFKVLYSRKTESHFAEAEAILGPKATKVLCSWKPVNEKILYERFVSNHARLSLIVCYALTNDTYVTLKDELYDNLQYMIDSIPLHDVTCIAGDLSAKVAQCRSYCPEVLGHHGLGTINKNGA